MGKNVGSVNLDELKAAREALDRERGIESDPNMYNNYDPEGHKAKREQEELARKQKDASDFSADENQQNAENLESSSDADISQNFSENNQTDMASIEKSIETDLSDNNEEVSNNSEFIDDEHIVISSEHETSNIDSQSQTNAAEDLEAFSISENSIDASSSEDAQNY